jgi:hypothetical protein
MTLYKQQAENGLSLVKQAIIGYITAHPEGVTNAQVATDLLLESDFEGKHQNYLSWSILGLLVNEGLIRYRLNGRSKIYFVSDTTD